MSWVGYRRPPVEHQFKPGHAKVGGRKRKPQAAGSNSSHVLDRMFELTIEGKRTKVRAPDAVAIKQLQLALEGDSRAAALVFKLDAARQDAAPTEVSPRVGQPTIVFTTFSQSALKALGVLTRHGVQSGESPKLASWVARAALERASEDFWDAHDVCKLALQLSEPMTLLDLVPEGLWDEWIEWASRPGAAAPEDDGQE